MVLWWALGVTVLYWSQAVSVEGLYATQAEFDRAAAVDGVERRRSSRWPDRPGRSTPSAGQVTWQSTAFGAIVVGLMSMFLIGRHTRAEEESGRDELVRAAAVDRHAPTTAAVLTAVLANLLVGLLVAGSLISFPLAVEDSLALGLGLTATGWVFTGVALVAAQLTSSTRATYGLVGAVIGVSFVLRAVGDVGNPALSWLSPIGWYQAMHAFSGVRWWPALLSAGRGGALTVGRRTPSSRGATSATACCRRGRARPGRPPACAAASGSAWRLHRGSLLGWALGLARDRSRLRLAGLRRGRPDGRQRGDPGRCSPRAAATSSTASTPPRCSRWRWWPRASPSPLRCGPGARRTTAGSSRCWRPGSRAWRGSAATSS